MNNINYQYKLPNKACDQILIEHILRQKGIILWGASYLGIKVGAFLKSKGIKVDSYWDKNAFKGRSLDGISVVEAFNNNDSKDNLIIICIGNNDIKNNLMKQLFDENYINVLSGDDLESLLAMSLSMNQEEHIKEVDCQQISALERMNMAVDYAIKSDNGVWKKQQEIIEWLRIVKNVVLFGMDEYHQGVKTFITDNGIKNVKYYTDFNGGKEIIDELIYIELEDLSRLDDVIVLILNQDYVNISKIFNRDGIKYCPFKFINMRVYSPYYNGNWFEKQKESIINTFELFGDEKSKEIYIEKLCNQIAPHLATKSFEDIMSKGEYFNHGIFELNEEEYLVDIGAFTGDSIESFILAVNRKFGAIYAFELEPNNFVKLKTNVNEMGIDMNKVELFNFGISDKATEFAVEGNNITARIITDAGTGKNVVRVVRLDDALKDRKVTFIKMDIEGSEMAALIGSQEIISNNKPKLAISSYHYLQDLWEIPKYIKYINPKYKIYLRHHTREVADTDCYAY